MLDGKTIIITGASGGIGSEIAKLMDKNGGNLILIGRNKDKLEILSKELNGVKGIYAIDFNNDASLKNTIKEIYNNFEKIDVLVNCAGVGIYKDINNASIEEWDNSFNVNVRSVFILISELLPLLEKSKNTKVINIGSGAGIEGIAGRSAYVASKFALRGLSLSLSKELSELGIQVSLLNIGSSLTDFGDKSKDEKLILLSSGKKYLESSIVAKKVLDMVNASNLHNEYDLFP